MPKYKVIKRIDSYSNYIAEIEAKDALTALAMAEANYKRGHHPEIKWEDDGISEFDDAEFEVEDSDVTTFP